METLINLSNYAAPTCISEEAAAAKRKAFADACGILAVANAEDFGRAQEVLVRLKSLIKGIDDAHREAKEPLLRAGRMLDELKRNYRDDLVEAEKRLSAMAGDFQRAEQIKLEAAKRAIAEQQAEIARQGAVLAAGAGSEEEKAAIADATAGTMVAARAAGMAAVGSLNTAGTRLLKSVDVDVVDVKALYKARPECVKLSPNMSVIKALVKAGEVLPGVVAIETVKTSVRAAPVIFGGQNNV